MVSLRVTGYRGATPTDWLRRGPLQWEHAAEPAVVEDYLLAIEQLESRLTDLDARLTELHDFRRFPNPRALMAYLGLVPSEDSSGDRHRPGRITKAGNGLVRRVLIEASWHYQHRAGVGPALAARREGQPARIHPALSRSRRSLHGSARQGSVKGQAPGSTALRQPGHAGIEPPARAGATNSPAAYPPPSPGRILPIESVAVRRTRLTVRQEPRDRRKAGAIDA